LRADNASPTVAEADRELNAGFPRHRSDTSLDKILTAMHRKNLTQRERERERESCEKERYLEKQDGLMVWFGERREAM
jgi:AAA+ ATPase superfamily predicted ATPase